MNSLLYILMSASGLIIVKKLNPSVVMKMYTMHNFESMQVGKDLG